MITEGAFVRSASFCALLGACSSSAVDRTGSADAADPVTSITDASVDRFPVEANPISLTLPLIWETEAPLRGTPSPLDGVRVCVEARRPHGGSWDDFERVGAPCATSHAGEMLLLEGVPAQSELILTLAKEGYVPRAVPVTTGQWDQDASSEFGLLVLFRPEALKTMIPGVELRSGVAFVFEMSPDFSLLLPGVHVALDPDGGAPAYFRGGLVVPDATATLAGSGAAGGPLAGAAFPNLAAGEYTVRSSRRGVLCNLAHFGDVTLSGYADGRPGAFRLPVLAGHVTVGVGRCACAYPPDATSCTIPDAG